ncbi:MAG TPA: sulfurtransferase TusA family protein [Burkholderiales bacterium]|nr:sulfurtransferase TusA family protein [Burkholderiales bacterium]
MTPPQADTELDVSGYNCPIPLLRTKKALAGMAEGKVLRVVSTDPGSEIDFRVYTEKAGHALLAVEERDGSYIFHIRKAGIP